LLAESDHDVQATTAVIRRTPAPDECWARIRKPPTWRVFSVVDDLLDASELLVGEALAAGEVEAQAPFWVRAASD
jgi:hypothetical protein